MVLENQLQDIRRQLDEKQYISIFPIQEIAETSEKALEKLIVQVKDLEDENVKLCKINEIFEFEIKNLQQAKIFAEKAKAPHLKFNDLFNTKVVSTQTIEFDKEKGDWAHISCCMASALEDLLMNNVKFEY